MPTQGVFSHLQPATCSCVQTFRSSDRYDLLSIVLDVLSSCNFEPLPILGTSRFLCGYFGKHALRHYVLRCSRVATVTFFQVHCAHCAFPWTKWFSPPDGCSSSSSSARCSGMLAFDPSLSPPGDSLHQSDHQVRPNLQGFSDFSPSNSLSHDKPWSSSSSMLLVQLDGQFTPMCLCSPQSWQHRVSLKPLPLTLFPLDSLSLSPYQSYLLPMRPFLPPFFPPSSLLPLGLSSAHSPRYHIPPPFGPFLPAPLPALYPCHAIVHTSSFDVSLLGSWSHCVVLASSVPTCTRSTGTGPSSAIISLIISNFSILSSNFSVPSRTLA